MSKRVSEYEIEAAWNRARPMSGRDPAHYRIAPDVIRSVIRRDEYGVRGEFGWRIEHGRPVAFRKTTTQTAIRALKQELVQAGGHNGNTADSASRSRR